MLAIAAVVDVALYARPTPVAAKSLAARHHLPPRHLETLLQGLVQANILKGHGRKFAYHIFLQFQSDKIADACKWMAGFAASRARASRGGAETSRSPGASLPPRRSMRSPWSCVVVMVSGRPPAARSATTVS